ncbi:predicted protein, partial [Nematostella vectensis]
SFVYTRRRVYWIDAKLDHIVSCEYDGSSKRIVLSGSRQINHPFAMTLFEDYLYWTDWQNKHVLRVSKLHGENVTLLSAGVSKPMDIHACYFHLLGNNLCGWKNGGCSQLCLVTGKNTRRCTCIIGYRLIGDGRTCEGINSFLLYTTAKEIRALSTTPGDTTAVHPPITGLNGASFLDFDSAGRWIYYSDERARVIRRVHVDGTGVQDIIATGLRRPQGIAVDWVGRNLFWCDAITDLIEVSRLNGSHRKVLISTGVSDPKSLAVYPSMGLLFWSDWGTPARIERASMDGSRRSTLISGPTVRKPTGLTLDYLHGSLYWVDSKKNSIWRINSSLLDGTDRKIIVSAPGITLRSIAVFGEFLYWTDPSTSNIKRVSKFNGGDTVQWKFATTGSSSMRVFAREAQDCTVNPCVLNGGCTHTCTVLDGKPVCSCPQGYRLENPYRC